MANKAPANSLGGRIARRRHELGLTQKQLAALAFVKQPTLSKLETGETSASVDVAPIAHALKVNPLWLQTGKGVMTLPRTLEAEMLELFVKLSESGKRIALANVRILMTEDNLRSPAQAGHAERLPTDNGYVI